VHVQPFAAPGDGDVAELGGEILMDEQEVHHKARTWCALSDADWCAAILPGAAEVASGAPGHGNRSSQDEVGGGSSLPT